MYRALFWHRRGPLEGSLSFCCFAELLRSVKNIRRTCRFTPYWKLYQQLGKGKKYRIFYFCYYYFFFLAWRQEKWNLCICDWFTLWVFVLRIFFFFFLLWFVSVFAALPEFGEGTCIYNENSYRLRLSCTSDFYQE
jgi:hypothetical protein